MFLCTEYSADYYFSKPPATAVVVNSVHYESAFPVGGLWSPLITHGFLSLNPVRRWIHSNMGHGSNSGQSILRPIDSSEGKHQTKSYTKLSNASEIPPKSFHDIFQQIPFRNANLPHTTIWILSNPACWAHRSRLRRWTATLVAFRKRNASGDLLTWILYNISYIRIYILKYLQEMNNRWHSPYILVYKDLLLTYLLVSVPSILTLRYPW